MQQAHLARLQVGVQELSAVHVPNAPIGVVRRLPVLLGLAYQALQLLLLLPLGLGTGGQVRLHGAVCQHLVLHQHCTAAMTYVA